MLHKQLIDEYGGSHGVRDENLLESVLETPFQSFGIEGKRQMDNHGEIIIYQTMDGLTNIEIKMQGETVCELEKLNLSEILTGS